MGNTNQLITREAWHWAVRAGLSLSAFLLAYGAFSYAVDRGSLLAYLVMIVLIVIGIRELLLTGRDTWRKRRA